MTNNEIFIQLRFALDLKDSALLELFTAAGVTMDAPLLQRVFKDFEEEDYHELANRDLLAFLDELIVLKRGPKPEGSKPIQETLSNNLILKKLRIAMNFKEEQMLECFSLADFPLSKSEMSALFRKRGHRNYKDCGDQILRYFIRGLTRKLRPEIAGDR